jgi:hypothetical protein
MLRSFVISISAVAILGVIGCRRGEPTVTKATTIPSSGVMVVNEVCSISAGWQTDGQRVTVRGTLNALKVGDYALFNSQWDPFDTEAGKDIPRIAIRFRGSEKPDDQLGWWVDVTGVIATTQQEDGRIAVTLEDAVIESSPSGEGVEMTPREKIVQQASSGQPATRSESKSEGGDKPQPEAEGRSR